MDFLIYIPCHSDIEQAFKQGKVVRSQFNDWNKSAERAVNLKLVLSINSYFPSEDELLTAKGIFDEVRDLGGVFLADANISQGFLVALLEKPKYFWLLSANDFIQPRAVELILKKLSLNVNLDILATNGSGLEGEFTESEVLNPPRSQMSYGLISSVIYNVETMGRFFSYAPFFPWTGWSQLSVLQGALRSQGALRVVTLPHFKIYSQNERSIEESGKHYAHSFYGMLILGSIFEIEASAKRRYIRRYLWGNFYNINLYSRKNSSREIISSEHYLFWNQTLAESIIKKFTPVTYVAYLILRKTSFHRIESFQVTKGLKSFFDKAMRKKSELNL
jgi:hypothetical protein